MVEYVYECVIEFWAWFCEKVGAVSDSVASWYVSAVVWRVGWVGCALRFVLFWWWWSRVCLGLLRRHLYTRCGSALASFHIG
jgi:hypothetical protein